MGERKMQIRSLVVPFFLMVTAAAPCYAKCGDIVLCDKQRPPCKIWHNVCSVIPEKPPVEMAPMAIPDKSQVQVAPTEAKPQYSITLDNLTKQQLDDVLDQLKADKKIYSTAE
jgi:hypothetical protein